MNTPSLSDLSPDQRVAYDGITSWLKVGSATKRTLTLGGYAGSGKSTVVSVLAHEMPKPLAFCAFTGKASSVLGRKLAQAGIATVNRVAPRTNGERSFEPRPYCGTIHGLVMRPCDICMVEEEYEHTYGPDCQEGTSKEAVAILDGQDGTVEELANPFATPPGKCLACNPPPPKKAKENCPRCNNARFLKRDRLDRQYRLIVVDEASMVTDDMLGVLLGYGIPILAVGDHGQLPPVGGTGSLMKKPDLRLEQIHRQAAGNPIIALSQKVRETGDIDDRLEDGEAFTILPKRKLDDWIASRFSAGRLAADPRSPEGILGSVLISWTNRTRVLLNHQVRAALGFDGETPPRRGEAMICLKNAAPIYNGMRGVLTGDAQQAGDSNGRAPKWKVTVDFVEDGQTAPNILISEHQLFAEKTLDYDAAQEIGVSMASLGQLYDMGYALTCHKMQGSQAPEVGVMIEGMFRMDRDQRTRWIYTAITRAAKHLTVIR